MFRPNKMVIRLLVLFAVLVHTVHSAKILCYFANPSKSHVLLALPICEELARRGHQLTVVTNHKHGLGGPNYTEIVVETRGFYGDIAERMSSGKMGMSPSTMMEVFRQSNENGIDTIKSAAVQKIMNDESFDLVFFISAFASNFNLGLADHFKAPHVQLTPMGNVYSIRDLIGAPSFVSTVPMKLSGFPSHMSFMQRLKSFGILLIEMTATKIFEYREARLYEELWPSDRYRSYDDMRRNVSAVFLNGHWSDSGVIRPTLPNEVDIGGIQIKATPKPLEPEVQTFLDAAEEGVIVWTFGSNIPITSIDPAKLGIFIKVLGKLKERVILRWEGDSKLPGNFMGRKWLAQDSILAHKNVKLFITHGGHGGTMEAMYHQVPILGIPFFGDQPANVDKAVADGWARGMTLDELTEENFSEAVTDLLTNTKYQENVKYMSEKYRDRLAGPLESAVFWMEYILKYNGAPHVTYSGRHLNFFQTYSLDVIAFIVVILYWLSLYAIALIKLIFKKLFGRKPVKEKKN